MPQSDPAQTAVLQQLGMSTWRPRLSHLRNAGWQWDVTCAPGSGRRDLAVAETRAELHRRAPRRAAHTSGDDMRPSPAASDKARACCKTLLRHAMLREIAYAAARIARDETNRTCPLCLRDADWWISSTSPVVNRPVFTPPTSFTGSVSSNTTAPSVTGSEPFASSSRRHTTFTMPALTSLDEFRESLARLKQTSTPKSCSLLTQSTLDLSAHRLDAWITSIATKRLAMMTPRRANRSVHRRVRLGGEPQPPFRPSMGRRWANAAGERAGTIPASANDSGLHSCAVDDARRDRCVAAQCARSDPPVFRRPTDPSRSTSPPVACAKRRDSSKVYARASLSVALLGYRVERLLHDTVVDNGRTMDRFIAPLRRVAPLVARSSAPTTAARRNHRREQRRRRAGAQSPLEAGAGRGARGARHRRAWERAISRRSHPSWTRSPTRSTA